MRPEAHTTLCGTAHDRGNLGRHLVHPGDRPTRRGFEEATFQGHAFDRAPALNLADRSSSNLGWPEVRRQPRSGLPSRGTLVHAEQAEQREPAILRRIRPVDVGFSPD
jgi:hypothetical protein